MAVFGIVFLCLLAFCMFGQFFRYLMHDPQAYVTEHEEESPALARTPGH